MGAIALSGNIALAQMVTSATFEPLLAGAHRSPGNVARDPYRHPAQTLAFFGIREDSTVVEILPGSGGYYMEILAPGSRKKACTSPPTATIRSPSTCQTTKSSCNALRTNRPCTAR